MTSDIPPLQYLRSLQGTTRQGPEKQERPIEVLLYSFISAGPLKHVVTHQGLTRCPLSFSSGSRGGKHPPRFVSRKTKDSLETALSEWCVIIHYAHKSFRPVKLADSPSSLFQSVKNPKTVYRHLQSLLGKKHNNPQVALYQKRFPEHQLQEDPARGTVYFKFSE